MIKELEFLESMKDCLTPNGDIFEHTKKYKDIHKAILELEGYRKVMVLPILKLISEMEILDKCRKTLNSINDIVAKYFNCIIDGEAAFSAINELLKDLDWRVKNETE